MARTTFVFELLSGFALVRAWGWDAKASMARRGGSIESVEWLSLAKVRRAGGEGCGIENLERAVRFAVERQLLEAGEKAPLVPQGGSVRVVPCWQTSQQEGWFAFWAELRTAAAQTRLGMLTSLAGTIRVGTFERAAPTGAKDR